MRKAQQAETVQVIPIDRIAVINPRVRNRKSFKDIVRKYRRPWLEEADHRSAQGRPRRSTL